MKQMTKQQINERVAEIAGFTQDHREDIGGAWRPPNEEDLYVAMLPDFTDSVDATIKWAVPVLHVRNCLCGVHTMGSGMIAWCNKAQNHNDSPSLALCLAIIEAVDGERVEVVG